MSSHSHARPPIELPNKSHRHSKGSDHQCHIAFHPIERRPANIRNAISTEWTAENGKSKRHRHSNTEEHLGEGTADQRNPSLHRQCDDGTAEVSVILR